MAKREGRIALLRRRVVRLEREFDRLLDKEVEIRVAARRAEEGIYCRKCGNVVDMDGGNMVAWENKEDVKACLDIRGALGTIEQAITDACERRKEKT